MKNTHSAAKIFRQQYFNSRICSLCLQYSLVKTFRVTFSMNKYLITALLSTSLTYTHLALSAEPIKFNGSTTNTVTGVTRIPNPSPVVSAIAYNDEVSVDTSKTLIATGNAVINDSVTINGAAQFISLSLLSNAAGSYGYLNFNSNGAFTYTLYDRSLSVLALSASQTLEESFQYAIIGHPEATAAIHVHIAGNPYTFIPQNDEISIDSQTASVAGSVASNDDTNGAPVSSMTWRLDSPSTTSYGFLKFDSAGLYTYNLYKDSDAVLAIQAGETVNDTFQYSIVGKDGWTSSAQLTVHITGNPLVIKAIDDAASVDTAVNLSATGNVLDNDLNVLKGSAALDGLANSNYGQLTFDSSGKFTYNLFSDAPAVLALKPGNVVADVFHYTVKASNGSGSATGKLTIRIAGNSSTTTSVTAVNDSATLVVDAATANSSIEMNVMNNDINVGSVSLMGSSVGQYGFIVGSIGSDGKLTYRVDLNNAAVQSALNTGTTLTDTFTYLAIGKAPNQNQTAQGKISIYIVAGTAGSFKAFDYIDTIIAEAGANPVSGELVAYNNNLLNSTDTSTHSQLISSQYGKYGYLQYSSSTSKFTYTLNNNVPEIQALRVNDNALQEIFKYRLINRYGSTADAQIVINIVSRREQVSTDNVEIERNNNSNLATPLNSGNYMRGNLMNPDDRDWYVINSNGNETIHIELCPQGFGCYSQGAWVMYAFNGDLLTQDMQNTSVPISLRRDDTGAVLNSYNETHMYLLYNYGKFDDALLGVIDPCYPPKNTDGTGGGRNSVEISVPTLAPGTTRNIFFAISSPLQRDGGGGTSTTTTCSGGSIILKKAGPTIKAPDPVDPSKSIDVKTTQESIGIFPNSDDQYTFKVSRTGVSPLSTATTKKTATYDANTGTADVPSVRIMDNIYSVALQQGPSTKSASSAPFFSIKNVTPLSQAVTPDPYMGTYNPANNIVKLPKVTIGNTNQAYSVDLRYLPNGNKLELMSASPLH